MAVLDEELLTRWALPTDVADKRERGTVLVIGGSSATVGAALLAGVAALRMGAGRLQLAVGAPAAAGLAVAVPEAKVVGLPEDTDGTFRPRRTAERLAPLLALADAVLIGPGLTGSVRTSRLLRWVIPRLDPVARVVLDAEALAGAGRLGADVLAPLRGRLVLTPNRTELASLLGGDAAGGDDAATAATARCYGAVVTCFSTIAAADGRCWQAPEGGPTLATSGSGDVLAGLVAGAAARTTDAAQAACWATYVHAGCALHAGRQSGELSVIARDLVDAVPAVMHSIESRHVPVGLHH